MFKMFIVSKSFIKLLLCFPYERNNVPVLRQTPKGQSVGVWRHLGLPSQTGGCLQYSSWGLALRAAELQAVAKLPPGQPGSCCDALCKTSQSSHTKVGVMEGKVPAAWDLFSAPCLRRRSTAHSRNRAPSHLPHLQEDLRGLRALPYCCGSLLNPRHFKQHTVIS